MLVSLSLLNEKSISYTLLRLQVDSRELPVKKSIKRRSKVCLTSWAMLSDSTVTPLLVKMNLFSPPKDEAYWSCFPMGIPILVISIYEAGSATCCFVIGCSSNVEVARTNVTAAALDDPSPVPGGTSLARKLLVSSLIYAYPFLFLTYPFSVMPAFTYIDKYKSRSTVLITLFWHLVITGKDNLF